MTTNPIDILLAHDAWATQQILLACQPLTPEQFAHPFDMGPGSLQATLTHILGAMQTWTDTLAQRPLGARLDTGEQRYSAAELLPLLATISAQFAALARAHPLDETVKRTRNNQEFSFARAAVITHVATHGMHHRAQCLNMLKQLGVKPLPLSSIAEWSRTADL
ncbi:MAG TPA: DinB family protein [Phycisphaerae bacterium]|nr:DinB family protein [Phycisphaerae bacterium]